MEEEAKCGDDSQNNDPHPFVLLPWIPHWWSLGRNNILLHWWKDWKNEHMASCLAYFSTPCGHPSSEIPMHPDHYCKRCTTCTSCCYGTWWMLSDLWYLIQQAFSSPILEAHLWTSWVSFHQRHFTLTCSLSGYGPFYHTCEELYLNCQMTLFQSHYHFHCRGF